MCEGPSAGMQLALTDAQPSPVVEPRMVVSLPGTMVLPERVMRVIREVVAAAESVPSRSNG